MSSIFIYMTLIKTLQMVCLNRIILYMTSYFVVIIINMGPLILLECHVANLDF